jgi:NitT/TauT family transport system ATP-binding protein
VVLAGKPATVVDDLPIDLGPDRDQITTRALPRFAELRSRVLQKIRASREPRSAPTGQPSAA